MVVGRRSASAAKKQHAYLYTLPHRRNLQDGKRRRARHSKREEQEGSVKREDAGSKRRAWRTGGASGGGQVVVGGMEVQGAHAASLLE